MTKRRVQHRGSNSEQMPFWKGGIDLRQDRSVSIPDQDHINYPNPEGQLSESLQHLSWKMYLFYLLSAMYKDRTDVLMLSDTMWYPVEGNNKICRAPDLMVVFGLPPQPQLGSYQQWRQDHISPQCVIEIKSSSNTPQEMRERLAFFDQYGAQECIIINPKDRGIQCFLRSESIPLTQERELSRGFWLSPWLDLRFQLKEDKLQKILTRDRRLFMRVEDADIWTTSLRQKNELILKQKERERRDKERERRERLAAEARAEAEHRERLAAEAKVEAERRERLAAEAKVEAERRERLAAEAKVEAERRERLAAEAELQILRKKLEHQGPFVPPTNHGNP